LLFYGTNGVDFDLIVTELYRLNQKPAAMKTLKVLLFLLIMSGLAGNYLDGQKPVKETVEAYIVLPFACTDQDLEGILTVERIFLKNHFQTRIYGTMTGTSDGLEYYFDGINNIADKGNWDQWGEKAITYTWPGNYHISRDGKLIGVVYFAFHMTVNANGEWSVYRGDVYEYSCVGEGKIK
jgi:hypothetical protein